MYFKRPQTRLSESLIRVELLASVPAFAACTRRRKASFKAGLSYEKKVQDEMEKIHGSFFQRSPWFLFVTKNVGGEKRSYCNPDGILIQPEEHRITICEIKLSHCLDAYYQLFELYLPVVRKFYGDEFSYHLLEITKWYDGTKVMPTKVKLAPDERILPPNQMCVKIWTP